jgi:hypothetical protein
MEPKLDLNNLFNNSSETVTLNGASDTITITGLSGYDYSNTTIAGGSASISASSYPYTVTGAGTGSPYITTGTGIASPWATHATPKIKLDGEGADIEVNGVSLMGLMKEIRERLNLITINEKMEKEWAELRALGEKYRELEQHIKDKQATWDRLKAMPPPVVD